MKDRRTPTGKVSNQVDGLENIVQKVIWVDDQLKMQRLYDVLTDRTTKPTRTIVFCQDEYTVEVLDDILSHRGLPTASIHNGIQYSQLHLILRDYRYGRCRILLTTSPKLLPDDVGDRVHIVNYDLPRGSGNVMESYLARMQLGLVNAERRTATSFYNEVDDGFSGPFLANMLKGHDQDVPDFLQCFTQQENKASILSKKLN